MGHQPGARVEVGLGRLLDDVLRVDRVEPHPHQVGHGLGRILLPGRVDGEPEVGVRVLHREAVDRTRHTGLLSPHDGPLTLHGDVGQDVDHRLARAHRALAGGPAHLIALAGAVALLGAEVQVVALQGHVGLVGVLPVGDRVGGLEAAGHEQVTRALGDRVYLLGERVVDAALGRVEAGQVRPGVGGVDAGATVGHGRVDLGDLAVALLGVAVVQVLLEVLHGDPLGLHALQQRPQLVGQEVLGLLGGAPVVELLLQVRVPLVGDVAGRGLDGLHDALGVDQLVLQVVDGVVGLEARQRDLPAAAGHGPGRLRRRLAEDVATLPAEQRQALGHLLAHGGGDGEAGLLDWR